MLFIQKSTGLLAFLSTVLSTITVTTITNLNLFEMQKFRYNFCRNKFIILLIALGFSKVFLPLKRFVNHLHWCLD